MIKVDALDGFEAADRQHVVAERARLQFAGERRRMVQRLGGQAVVAREPRGRVAGVAEEARDSVSAPRSSAISVVAQPDVGFGVVELAVRRAAEIVDRAVLMEQPGDLVGVPGEVGRELGRDDRVDALAVGLAQVDHPPRGGVRQQLVLSDTT